MPTSGSIISFNQSLPLYADKPALGNVLSSSIYKTLSEDVVGAGKFYIASINGLDDDVRLSNRTSLSSKDYEVLKEVRLDLWMVPIISVEIMLLH